MSRRSHRGTEYYFYIFLENSGMLGMVQYAEYHTESAQSSHSAKFSNTQYGKQHCGLHSRSGQVRYILVAFYTLYDLIILRLFSGRMQPWKINKTWS